jgi:hypothetical protein
MTGSILKFCSQSTCLYMTGTVSGDRLLVCFGQDHSVARWILAAWMLPVGLAPVQTVQK